LSFLTCEAGPDDAIKGFLEVLIMKFAFFAFFFPILALANPAFEAGKNAIHSMTGCYLVDYSYSETQSLKEGYALDPRVYDVNSKMSVKEWIYAMDLGPSKIRLQHILFATDLDGSLMSGSELRHQAEDWEFEAPFLYDFSKPLHWDVKRMERGTGEWTRRITNLDDGLRYQCSAPWLQSTAYPEWTCENYSPIPGRETRDMGRKDYNTLQRITRIMAYGNSWLERQYNTKTIFAEGVKTPLAKEVGKNWYVRLPDSECAPAKAFMEGRTDFWNLLRETWDEVLDGAAPFVEKLPAGAPPRFAKMLMVEEQYKDLSSAAKRAAAKQAILEVIREYRAE